MTKEQLLHNIQIFGGRNAEIAVVAGRTVIKGFLPSINKKFEVRCTGLTDSGKFEDGYHKFAKLVRDIVPPSYLGPKRPCPKCKRPMKIRVSKKGDRFWGCSGWRPEKPKCTHTIDIPKGVDPMEAK